MTARPVPRPASARHRPSAPRGGDRRGAGGARASRSHCVSGGMPVRGTRSRRRAAGRSCRRRARPTRVHGPARRATAGRSTRPGAPRGASALLRALRRRRGPTSLLTELFPFGRRAAPLRAAAAAGARARRAGAAADRLLGPRHPGRQARAGAAKPKWSTRAALLRPRAGPWRPGAGAVRRRASRRPRDRRPADRYTGYVAAPTDPQPPRRRRPRRGGGLGRRRRRRRRGCCAPRWRRAR